MGLLTGRDQPSSRQPTAIAKFKSVLAWNPIAPIFVQFLGRMLKALQDPVSNIGILN